MAADKPLIRNRLDQRPLGRPNVRDDAVVRGGRKSSADQVGERINRPAGKDRLSTLDSGSDGVSGTVNGPALERSGDRMRPRTPADNLGTRNPLASSKPNRPANEANS